MTTTPDAPTGAAPPTESSGYRSYVLGMLLLIYVLNFVDRQIIGILLEPIKADFAARGEVVDDAQMGLLGGLAFALFYTFLGIPLAWLADRYNRVTIITVALATWSGFTVLCGMATTYWHLLLARVGVGAGEAGGSPPSQSLISDYFTREKRASAMAVWSLGIPIGSAVGIIGGAWVNEHYGWQMAFIVAGLPGLIVAVIFKLTVREPARGRFDPPTVGAQPTLGQTFAAILGKPTFWLLALGASLASFVGYAVFVWGPAHFIRSFELVDPTTLNLEGLTPEQAQARIVGAETLVVSYFSAITIGLAASIGTLFGGRIVDKLGQKDARAYVTVPALALLACVPLNLFVFQSSNVLAAALVILIPTALGAMWYGPIFGLVQNLVQPRMRAMAVAILFFIINLVGLGGGPTLVGQISKTLGATYGPAVGLQVALLVASGVGVLAAALMYAARFTLKRDMAQG
jgi:MFS family permease